MLTLLLAAALGQIDYAASAKTPPAPPVASALPAPKADPSPPAPTVKTLTPPPVTAPAPIEIKFHEDTATKDDLVLLGEKITSAIKPLDTRLTAVERKTDDLARDVAVLKYARQAPPAKTADAPPPERRKLYLTDAEGVQCWGWDEAELRDRVARRNEFFARRNTRIVDRGTYVSAPMVAAPQYVSPPMMDFGSFGGGFSMPMTLGGGFMGGGGCAGGNCR